jgi:diphthamide synthase (EF-2-diphthine--ammonia ligase)
MFQWIASGKFCTFFHFANFSFALYGGDLSGECGGKFETYAVDFPIFSWKFVLLMWRR